MKISKGVAQELLELGVGDSTADWEDDNGEEYPLKFKLVRAKMIDNSRWSIIHEVVYKDEKSGKFYLSTYSIGATECQDESPYEYEEEVELTEVAPVEVTVIKYEVVK